MKRERAGPSTYLLAAAALIAIWCMVGAVVAATMHPSYASAPFGLACGVILAYLIGQRVALKQQAAAEAAIKSIEPSEVPIGVAALAVEAGEGNIQALAILWQALYKEPLNPDRPMREIVAEVEVALAAQYGRDA